MGAHVCLDPHHSINILPCWESQSQLRMGSIAWNRTLATMTATATWYGFLFLYYRYYGVHQHRGEKSYSAQHRGCWHGRGFSREPSKFYHPRFAQSTYVSLIGLRGWR